MSVIAVRPSRSDIPPSPEEMDVIRLLLQDDADFINSFRGHLGRPGHRGGSLPVKTDRYVSMRPMDIPQSLKESLIKEASNIPVPKNADEVPEFVRKFDSLDSVKRVNSEIMGVSTVSHVQPTVLSLFANKKDGQWTKDRQKIHEAFVDKYFNPKAAVPAGEKPKLIFVLGPPGSGKSTTGVPLAKKMAPEFTYINPDDAKEFLPEYRGWNASYFHEEGWHMAEDLLLSKALKNRHNIVYDATGNSSGRILKLTDLVKKLGYETHCIVVRVRPETSVARAYSRFVGGTKDAPAGYTGRLVPLGYVAKSVHKGDGTIAALTKHPDVKSLTILHNDDDDKRIEKIK